MSKKTKVIIAIITIISLASILTLVFFIVKNNKETQEKEKIAREKKQLQNIQKHFSKTVTITKKAKLYKKENNKYTEIAQIEKDETVSLKDENITLNTKYFYLEDLNLYIKYQDVLPTPNNQNKDIQLITTTNNISNQRYKKYLPFNENIITKENAKLYRDNKLVYTIKNPINKEIIIKDDNGYYIEYFNELLFINKDDISQVVPTTNSNQEESTAIPVLCYHFIYLEGDTSCNELICSSKEQIHSQFQVLKDNNYFTLTTTELRLFLEDKIRIPKNSVLITIDDGARAENFIPLLEEFQMNATLFLISSWYPKEKFASPYMEIASHTHDYHNGGYCPGGQGSALKCLDRDKLLTDLKTSRETLNNTEAFCYPFYEFNDYAINIVKEAGFKIAFIGGMQKATKNTDPLKVPRYSIHADTSLDNFKSYIE